MSNKDFFIFDTDQAQIYSALQMLNKPAFVDHCTFSAQTFHSTYFWLTIKENVGLSSSVQTMQWSHGRMNYKDTEPLICRLFFKTDLLTDFAACV